MTERVLVNIIDHVAHVRLNRPDKRNGLDLPMFEGIIAAGEQVAADRAVRAVVLSGEGAVFCAGLDWGAFLAMGLEAGQRLLERPSGPANVAQRVAWVWQECPVPVIAAVHGAALGGGLQIALGADLRYATADAKFAVMEIRYGLIPDMGITRTLAGLVRPDVARELVFTGRTVLGEEAARIGLVTRVCVDPLGEAMVTAKEIAALSPHAVRAGKRLMRDAPTDVLASFTFETALQMELLGTPNQAEAVQAMMGRRPGAFSDH